MSSSRWLINALASTAFLVLGIPSAGQAQPQFYVDPYMNSPYYGRSSPYPYATTPYPYAAPYSYYDSRHHYDLHRKFHWSPEAGLHWGTHYGRHRIGSHDFRYYY